MNTEVRGEGRESISATLTVFLFPAMKKYARVFGLSQLVLSGVVFYFSKFKWVVVFL